MNTALKQIDEIFNNKRLEYYLSKEIESNLIKKLDSINWYEKDGNEENIFFYATNIERAEKFCKTVFDKVLLDENFPINAQNKKGYTVLHELLDLDIMNIGSDERWINQLLDREDLLFFSEGVSITSIRAIGQYFLTREYSNTFEKLLNHPNFTYTYHNNVTSYSVLNEWCGIDYINIDTLKKAITVLNKKKDFSLDFAPSDNNPVAINCINYLSPHIIMAVKDYIGIEKFWSYNCKGITPVMCLASRIEDNIEIRGYWQEIVNIDVSLLRQEFKCKNSLEMIKNLKVKNFVEKLVLFKELNHALNDKDLKHKIKI